MYDVILTFCTAFLTVFFVLPIIIRLAKTKQLYDVPVERSSHKGIIPRLGGVGIFAGMFFAVSFWAPYKSYAELQYILCAFMIIFLIGAKDDIDPISPTNKFLGEIAAAFVLITRAGIRVSSFYGVFGITELPYYLSVAFTLFIILLIINAVNLIDGINGLAGSVGGLICLTLGTWFYMTNRLEMAIVAVAMLGAIVAFLRYNVTPAKVFMGDTGSLLIGLTVAILSIEFMEANKTHDFPYAVRSVPAVAIGVLIVPLFDTLRVFITRALRGKSPFHPDKTHIHHLLLNCGLSHMQATGSLFAINAMFIVMVFSLHTVGPELLIILIVSLALVLTAIPYWISRQRKKRLANS